MCLGNSLKRKLFTTEIGIPVDPERTTQRNMTQVDNKIELPKRVEAEFRLYNIQKRNKTELGRSILFPGERVLD